MQHITFPAIPYHPSEPQAHKHTHTLSCHSSSSLPASAFAAADGWFVIKILFALYPIRRPRCHTSTHQHRPIHSHANHITCIMFAVCLRSVIFCTHPPYTESCTTPASVHCNAAALAMNRFRRRRRHQRRRCCRTIFAAEFTHVVDAGVGRHNIILHFRVLDGVVHNRITICRQR